MGVEGKSRLSAGKQLLWLLRWCQKEAELLELSPDCRSVGSQIDRVQMRFPGRLLWRALRYKVSTLVFI